MISRENEHGEGRKAHGTDVKVALGQQLPFHHHPPRRALTWLIDGNPFLAWTDPAPLAGAGHEYFAVNDWEAHVTFDNLRIRPAP